MRTIILILFLWFGTFAEAQTSPSSINNYNHGTTNDDPKVRRGRDTWFFWTGGDEKFLRLGTKLSGRLTQGKWAVEYFHLIDSRLRDERFATFGVINEPNTRKATKPDRYGLWLDEWDGDPNYPDTTIYGEPTGIVGLRKFKNPAYDPDAWNVNDYFAAPDKIEPPYLVGMACAFCHMAFDPTNPPKDLLNPRWENLSGTIGNQYLREGELAFGKHGIYGQLDSKSFLWHLGATQQAGTSDTSRIAYDFINNPNAINSISYLSKRVRFHETSFDGIPGEVPHILKDGADSQGVATASLRVYTNLGVNGEVWLTHLFNPFTRDPQTPYRIDLARRDSQDWRETEERMPYAEAYLNTTRPYHLEDAPGGKEYTIAETWRDSKIDSQVRRFEVLRRGKQVFADECARCHSNKKPDRSITDPVALRKFYRDSVLSDDFLVGNTLTDDVRYPITEIGTNAARALGTNATAGHLWEEFSSKEYKALPTVGTLSLFNPFDPLHPLQFAAPGGGVGYYRTASLVSIWATSPWLHNNSLGIFTGDPSVEGRMIAFEDAARKLLWPERRLGIGSMKVTTVPSELLIPKDGQFVKIPIPANTPINLLANLHIDDFAKALAAFQKGDVGEILKLSQCPDLIEDKGHTFGSELTDADKLALIEFLKKL
jgi:hypothetical protein